MKSHVLLLGFVLGMAGPVVAGPAAHNDVSMSATVQKVCQLGAPTVVNSQNAAFDPSSQGGTITFNTLADGNTAQALPSTISVTFQSVCNQALDLHLISTQGGLTLEHAAPGGGVFQEHVDYTATLNWGSNSATLATDGTAKSSAGVSLTGAQSGAVTLTITIPAGSQPLVSGNYADFLTVEFDSGL